MNKTVSEKIASEILENYLKGLELRGIRPEMGHRLQNVYESIVKHVEESDHEHRQDIA